jgi:hypothetical protein
VLSHPGQSLRFCIAHAFTLLFGLFDSHEQIPMQTALINMHRSTTVREDAPTDNMPAQTTAPHRAVIGSRIDIGATSDSAPSTRPGIIASTKKKPRPRYEPLKSQFPNIIDIRRTAHSPSTGPTTGKTIIRFITPSPISLGRSWRCFRSTCEATHIPLMMHPQMGIEGRAGLWRLRHNTAACKFLILAARSGGYKPPPLLHVPAR